MSWKKKNKKGMFWIFIISFLIGNYFSEGEISIAHFIIFIATVVIGIVNDQFGPSILIVSIVSIFVFGANIYKTLKPAPNK